MYISHFLLCDLKADVLSELFVATEGPREWRDAEGWRQLVKACARQHREAAMNVSPATAGAARRTLVQQTSPFTSPVASPGKALQQRQQHSAHKSMIQRLHGVTCDSITGEVRKLNLTRNKLNGKQHEDDFMDIVYLCIPFSFSCYPLYVNLIVSVFPRNGRRAAPVSGFAGDSYPANPF